MTALIDTGFLYAIADKGDINHTHTTNLLPKLDDELLLPITVMVEIAYRFSEN